MSEPGTPQEYIDTLAEPRRGDIAALDALIREAAPDLEPVLAGRMLGYGPFHYRYASGREGDATLIALASRKRYISVYVLCSTEGAYLAERYAPRLTGASVGKSCVRLPRPAAVDTAVLRELVGRRPGSARPMPRPPDMRDPRAAPDGA
ncbi:DUF1801 domain-containing protein [Pseudonocardia benzenivorans]|jgi:hypothetical protein|uniref:DUF1801 domain-containing protein n=1 Tax=Pseudonocardia benzenivorans TaxID=228005 RepID=A0ABW3VLI8_9PSEU